ncbi:MAG: TIGR03435 family protein [Bryobacterales bacterium]|nr:TIGR03435 family protein [Bryobacterales bacterium]MBV9399949.1 TIGR03435 family protein [Bryobacterales bacterium]
MAGRGRFLAFALVLLGGVNEHSAFAQSFEVASIKSNNSGSRNSSWNTNDGGVRAENISLKQMIELAYDVKDYSFSGPAWLDSDRFDILAKAPARMKSELFAPMLQSLLAERFGLKVHREPKSVAGYALLAGKKPPESHEMPKEGGSSVNWSSGKMDAKNASIRQIADFLARQLGQPVEDQTSLKGAFDLKLTWTADDPLADAAADAPSIFTAVQEQLGLKLQPAKVIIDIVVVDRIERMPTEN